MPRNRVQFQKGLSLAAFLDRYGSESACREALLRWRWPAGFVCPGCGYGGRCRLQTRSVLQCHRCHRQTAATAGTIFAGSKLPLRSWFLALYLLTQAKNGLSTLSLARQLGVAYNSAWLLKHKLMQVMLEQHRQRPLAGLVQLDDAYWGGRRRGQHRGRGTAGKVPLLAAVATDAQTHRPSAMRLTPLHSFRQREVNRWVERHLATHARIHSDAFAAFATLADTGRPHRAYVTSGRHGRRPRHRFHWVDTLLGNVKNALKGTYHGLRPKHLPRYLAEFGFRFNHRRRLDTIAEQLGQAAALAPPLPYRLATLAEPRG